MEEYKVSAGIVVYNKPDDAVKTVGELLKYADGNFTLYVMDNTPDGSINSILKEKYDAVYIDCGRNLGFGRAHNKVIDLIDSKYHFVINPDVLVNSDTVKNLCAFMDENPTVAIACPKVLNPDGSIQMIAKRRPGLLSLVSRRIKLPFLKRIEREYLMADADPDIPTEVDFCTGCFFVIRTDVFKKIGGFDPDYFLYFEDADITMRAKKEGQAYYAPCASIIHFWHRRTAHEAGRFMTQVKSMFTYFGKWGFKLK